jgi:exopolysaccharide production protein ExoZ
VNSAVKSEVETIQILRAVAATSVVYFHTFADPHFGRFGVDIFFVISGFVMAMIVAGGQTATEFALQRIIRIAPLYWTLTTVFLVAAKIRPDLAPSTDPTLLDYIRSLLFIPYFKEDGTLCPILTVGWTLNYEMFFYSCIWVSMGIFRRGVLWITLGLLVVAYVLLGKAINNPITGAFFGNEILVEFLFGMVLFELYMRGVTRGSVPILLLGAAVAFCFMVTADTNQFVVNRALIFGVPSAILVYFVTGLQSAINIRSAKIIGILVGIGNASYATYLTHYFVIQSIKKLVVNKINASFNPLWLCLTVVVALTIGHVVDRFIDRPINRLLKMEMRRRLVSVPPNAVNYRAAR